MLLLLRRRLLLMTVAELLTRSYQHAEAVAVAVVVLPRIRSGYCSSKKYGDRCCWCCSGVRLLMMMADLSTRNYRWWWWYIWVIFFILLLWSYCWAGTGAGTGVFVAKNNRTMPITRWRMMFYYLCYCCGLLLLLLLRILMVDEVPVAFVANSTICK